MCGICGFTWEDRKLVEKLTGLLEHRGPDNAGCYNDRKVSLGHRRLSIIDLSSQGSQPMCNEDSTVWITYNGEIFNFMGLRQELEEKGHKFRSRTDTEVLIHGYEEWGTGMLSRLNGQFAFCIYDIKKARLLLARDPAGINPLYYCHNGKKLIFGSELKVILKSGLDVSLDTDSLRHFALFGYTPPERTIIREALKLSPGSFMVFDLKSGSITEKERYWKPDFTIIRRSDNEAARLVREALERAVRRRLVSDVPLGAFLSGGIDSSAVVAMMSRHARDINTFSIRFDVPSFDESRHAAIVSRKFRTVHHEIRFTSGDIMKLIERIAYYYDEPFGDPSMVPTFLVSKTARQKVKVALSGDGGDELFGGYEKYLNFRLISISRPLRPVLAGLSKLIKKPAKLRRFLLYSGYKAHQAYASLDSYRYIEDMGKEEMRVYDEYIRYFRHSDWLSNLANADLHSYLPEDILVKVDRASMANSLESRPPFLDTEMMGLAFSIPSGQKIRRMEKKYILKKAMKGILPDEIIHRKKQGFESPISVYFRKEFRDYLVSKLGKPGLRKSFPDIDIDAALNAHLEGKEDYSRQLWSLLMFQLWKERWADWLYD